MSDNFFHCWSIIAGTWHEILIKKQTYTTFGPIWRRVPKFVPHQASGGGGGGQYWWDILSRAEGGVLCSTIYKVLKDSSQDGCQRIRCSRIMHDDLVGSLSGMLCVICVCGSLQILVLRWYLFWIMHPTTYLAIWVRYPKENQDINSSPNMVLFCWFAGLSLS